MKKFILAFFIIASAAFSGAKAQMPVRSIHVSGYNTINVSSAIDVVFDNRFEDSIYVESCDALIDKLEIEIKGTKVSIGYSKAGKGAIKSNRKSVVYMSASALTALSATGESDIVSNQRLAGKNIGIKLSGKSTLKADVETAAAGIKLSGESSFEGSVNCTNASFSLSGSSSVRIISGKCSKLSLATGGESSFDGRNLSVTSYSRCSLGASSKADLVLSGNTDISTAGSAALFAHLDCKKTSINMSKTGRVTLNGNCKTLVLKTSGNCDFKNPGFVADNSVSCTASGSGTIDVHCRGNVSVKASDACNINVHCTGVLKIAASGTSNVTYTEGAKVASLSIKDQATSRAVKESPAAAYNPAATLPIIR